MILAVLDAGHISVHEDLAMPLCVERLYKHDQELVAVVQIVIFADDKIVSKGMVKYASLLPRESIVDVEGTIFVPQNPIQGCTQSQVGSPDCNSCCIASTCLQRTWLICRAHLDILDPPR